MIVRNNISLLFLACLIAFPTLGQSQPGTAPNISFQKQVLTVADGRKIEAEIGFLHVPENRTKKDSNTIELAVARLTSRARQPGPPLVFLAGGPGDSATSSLWSSSKLPLWDNLLDVCDVVLMDQRGTGRSKPQLILPAIHDTADLLLTRKTAVEYFTECAQDAVEHFEDEGVDLSGYTTVESAEDVEALRHALGVKKINLLGFSYGTHLGLEVIRRHGKHIKNAILISVAGPEDIRKRPGDQERQWNVLSDLAAADPRISSEIPDLRALLSRVLNQLDEQPIVVRVHNSKTRRNVKVPVGKFGLQLLLVLDLGDTSDLPIYPRLLQEIDRGETGLLGWFVEKRYNQFRNFHMMSLLMRTASEASPDRWEVIQSEASTSLFSNAANIPYPEIRKAWSFPDLGDSFRRPIKSNVRTLFLTGSLDVNTPPHQSDRIISQGIPNSTHITIKNGGHESFWDMPGAHDVIRNFLKGENVEKMKLQRPALEFIPLKGLPSRVSHPSLAQE